MKELADLLSQPFCLATTVFSVAYGLMGGEIIEYDIETSIEEVERVFDIKLGRLVRSKLGAAIALHATNQFFLYLEPFGFTCKTFNDDDPFFDKDSPPDPFDLVWGVTEALMMTPIDETIGNVFSEEVRIYTGALLEYNGITTPPKVLGFAVYPDDIQGTEMAEWAAAAHLRRTTDNLEDLTNYTGIRLGTLQTQLNIVKRDLNSVAGVVVPVSP